LPGGGAWDEHKLRAFFFDEDVHDILNTRVGRPGANDFIAWNFKKNGLFSVKSVYHLATELRKVKEERAESSRSCNMQKGWLSLWLANVPGKVKVNCWRLIENGLAVGAELKYRRIKDGVNCLVCDKEESLVHRFWTCSHSAFSWELLSDELGLVFDKPPKCLRAHSDLKSWLLEWMGKSKHEIIEWFMLLINNMWLARNDARESQIIEDPRSIVKRTMVGMEEWRNIHKPKEPKKVVRELWRPPCQDQFKINVDGAFRAEASAAGGGAVIRDCHGGFFRGSCCLFPQVKDVEGSELLACKQGLTLTREAQARKIVLEMDSAVVASKLRSEGQDRSVYG
jgi:hypothetical protein